jgi:hypothetical protein
MGGKRVPLKDKYMMTPIDIQKTLEELKLNKKQKVKRNKEN